MNRALSPPSGFNAFYWECLEKYISERSETQFSHGICPECARQLYPDLYRDKS